MADDPTVPPKELADMLGITVRTLRELAERGIAIKAGRGRYDMRATVTGYVSHLRATAAGRGGEDQIATLTAQRARLAREQADEKALRNAALRGEFVKASEVERTWADVLRRVRSGVLAVPSRVRQSVPHLNAHDVEAIDGELRRALEVLGADG